MILVGHFVIGVGLTNVSYFKSLQSAGEKMKRSTTIIKNKRRVTILGEKVRPSASKSI